MPDVVLTLPLDSVEDVLLARRRARDLAGLLQLGAEAQSRLATAAWEAARLAQRSPVRAEAQLAVGADPGPTVEVLVRGMGDAAIDVDALAQLVDRVETDEGAVRLACLLDADAWVPGTDELALVLRSLQHHESGGREAGVAELRQQNAELAAALASLTAREAELSQANRGITALVAELQEQAAELRAVASANARFLHGLAHELRTPLYAVRGMTEAILRDGGDLDDTTREDLRLIDGAILESLELINDQLDLARLQAGREAVRIDKVDVGQLFADLDGVLRRLPRHEAVDLVFEAPTGLPALRTDALKLSQILRNLVTNALKVTESGAVRVSATSPDASRVCFAVTDTGPGLDDADRARIFEEWVQVGTPRSEIRGTGLGLPLVRRLSELLGGEVTVRSAPGAGATFVLELPTAHPGSSAAVDLTTH